MKNRKAAQKKRILLSFRLGGSDAVMISFTCQLCTQCGLSVSVCLHGTYVVMCNQTHLCSYKVAIVLLFK